MELNGLLPPVVTPVRDGQPDPEAIGSLVEHLVDSLHGMVVCGSVGEGPSLSIRQRERATKAFAEALGNRGSLILGCAATALEDLEPLVSLGEELEVAGFLVPVPFYFRHSAASVRDFYGRVASWTEREVVIYDNPATTKTAMGVSDILALAEAHPNLRHVKLTDPDPDKPALLAGAVRPLAGSDEVMHHQVSRGCVGAMTGIPQIYPRDMRSWFEAARGGEERTARALYDRVSPMVIELMLGPDRYPAVIKYALWRLGVISDPAVLPPLLPLDDLRRREVDLVLELTQAR